MESLAILKQARERLAENWSRLYGYGDPATGKCCVIGAINIEAHGGVWGSHYTETLHIGTPAYVAAEYVADAVGLDYDGDRPNYLDDAIADWNDDPARAKEEVLAAFEKAIEACEKDAA